MTDVIVLGAGMVGVGAGLHLLKRGKRVTILDRRGPGEETSFGNAGVIEPEALVPVAFPRRIGELVQHALRRSPASNYHLLHLPRVLPWLWALRRETDVAGIERYAAAIWTLCRHARAEHDLLAAEAEAQRFFRHDGWVRLYRTPQGFADAALLHRLADRFGISYKILDTAGLAELEPHLKPIAHKAVWWPEVDTVSSPGGVTVAYADLFRKRGGTIVKGDARSLTRAGDLWRVETAEGGATAPDVVVALGPWTPDLVRRFGLRLPMAVKRGYHMHFAAEGNAILTRPIIDPEKGYVITPMERGIRLTTGIEFADRDAPPTDRQIRQLLPIVRELFPLGEPRDAEPWLGRRPVFADSLPAIGRAPGVPGLWVSTGHGHLGFTLGPISGRLLADMMTGAPPVADPQPFRPERFG